MNIKRVLYVANKDILVIDDPAFTRCVDLHRSSGCYVEILMVVEEKDIPGLGVYSDDKYNVIKKEVIEKKKKMLEVQLDSNYKIKAGIKIRYGIQFIEIIKESVEFDFDLIVKHQDVRLKGLHSIDLHLLRKTQVPLWLIRDETLPSGQNIVTAIDLDLEKNGEGKAINKKIIDVSKRLSEELTAEVKVLSCWSVSGEEFLRNKPLLKVDNVDYPEILSLEETRYSELMKNFLAENDLGSHALIRGEAAESISDFINFERPSLLVIGSFSRTGIKGYLIGNTAEDVLLSIKSSVLVVKPEGFISPVV
ncbi:universal stress protein [Neptuniibacter sp.]|uniref:universal stress protein n=1 Tax=Neptuniibacter sp. TaxID=1962643 RepID=UPI002608B021|nr:universal stress protein [Neptuniibacter sp.]MCP4596367.1 universal stress protein [Neptuniibacter sp.]